MTDGIPERVVSSAGHLSDQRLELGGCHLDGVQVWAVRGKEKEPGTDIG
jgi:hypothetical protein